MKIILLGPPGSGKGTQAQAIAQNFSLPQISTGDMLRESVACHSDLGQRVKEVLHSGGLVPDDLILSIVQKRVGQNDCQNGFLFDGFPRTKTQAKGLETLKIAIDWVIELRVDTETLIQRLSGRRIHPSSGRTYHIIHNPPRKEGLDDLTHEPLVQREDDHKETIIRRFTIYQEQTAPLVEFYTERAQQQDMCFAHVNGGQTTEKVTADIFTVLSSRRL